MAEITKLLHLSTAHVSEETAKMLDGEGTDLAVYANEYGWLVAVNQFNPGNAESALPADLQACCEFAKANGCSRILFDRDCDATEGLPTYDW